ncbi:hypothetical protein G5V65_11320 [Rhodobacter sp. HX-7-19]|uniref:Uncharacterized protein n=1 Tax=Paragemmobacter kunshanensis TaxID=2583234 RepID=A0A6M1TUW3_9RHOB|nr:hypothetical protein [Rhodobacter kunshanensis]NGQ91487.1 hypothetical protein [Rhodobacter kunshanensis]
MISANIQNITKAEAEEHGPGEYHGAFGVVTVFCESRNVNETVNLFLPAGTAEAVAACINVAVAAGAQQAKADKIAALKREWNRVCEAMNVGSWHGSETDALAEIERIKARIAELESEDA